MMSPRGAESLEFLSFLRRISTIASVSVRLLIGSFAAAVNTRSHVWCPASNPLQGHIETRGSADIRHIEAPDVTGSDEGITPDPGGGGGKKVKYNEVILVSFSLMKYFFLFFCTPKKVGS